MNQSTIYNTLLQAKEHQQKKFAVLIDPDKVDENSIQTIVTNSIKANIDYFFVGGSLLTKNEVEHWITVIKQQCNIPTIIFPGSLFQVNDKADALFLLSLVSGRNPDLLIGQHVVAAPILKQMDIEIMSTAYMLVDGGQPTTVSYISNSLPIPQDKPQIAACTAMAGELLGMKIVYMDAGSGAKKAITPKMIQTVRKSVDVPIIVGGGIRTAEQAVARCQAGADLIVVGNAIETAPELVFDMSEAIHGLNS